MIIAYKWLCLSKMVSSTWRIPSFFKSAVTGLFYMRYVQQRTIFAETIPTRTTSHLFNGKNIYIKRDDEGGFLGKSAVTLSGNKSRKLLHLWRMKTLPKVFVSYGGPQSNSMLAIAKVAAQFPEQKSYFYFVKRIPKFLRTRPNGNLKAALELGMQVTHRSCSHGFPDGDLSLKIELAILTFTGY